MRKALLILPVLLLGCKTTNRDDSGGTSSVTVKVPAEYATLDATAILTPLNGDSPRTVRGKDLKIRVPIGIYRVSLILADNTGAPLYGPCDEGKTFDFKSIIESAIIPLCAYESDPATPAGPVAKNPTGTSGTVASLPDAVTGGLATITTGAGTTTTMPATQGPQITFDAKCFGMDAKAAVENGDVVYRIDDTIRSTIITNLTYLTCGFSMPLVKGVNQVATPIRYKVAYDGDDATFTQNLWIMASGVDDQKVPQSPCDTMGLNTKANSQKSYICAFYDTTAANPLAIIPRLAQKYQNACQGTASSYRFDLTLAGPNNSLVSLLRITEVRIGIPSVEVCH